MFLPDVHVNCQMFFFRINGNSKGEQALKTQIFIIVSTTENWNLQRDGRGDGKSKEPP